MITYEDKVALNENSDIADINKVTAGDMNEIKQVVNSLANLFFPVKKIVMFNDNDDHSNYLGFTWERIASGKVLIGIDSTDTDFNTIGKTGGEKEHTLTIDEMPAHSHKLNGNTNVTFDDSATYPYLLASAKRGYATGSNVTFGGNYTINDTTTIGGGQAHNNMPPYQVAAFWQRIS